MRQLKIGRRGFSLFELLVVIAIIGILSGITVIAVVGLQEKARIARGQAFSASIYHTLGNELVGFWKFEEEISDPTPWFTDSSTHGNDGFYNNYATCNPYASGMDGCPERVEGMEGRALFFDQGTQETYGQVTDNMSLDVEEAITIEFWVKRETSDAGGVVYKENSYMLGWLDEFNPNDFWFTLNFVSAGEVVIVAEIPEIGVWKHIAATWEEGKTMRLFVDGDLKVESAGTYNGDTIEVSSSNIDLGRKNGPQYLDGTIDELRIYNAAFQ